MSSVTDFLFEGQPPKSVTTYGQTVENVPKWMSDYTQGLVAKANSAAAEPYIPYEGPRIAGFTPDQTDSFGLTQENVGSAQPYLEAGSRATAGGLAQAARAGDTDVLAAGKPYLDQASGRWTDPNVASSYMNPYIQNVLDREAELSNRNLTEKFIPSLQKTFAGAGQYGSRGGTGSMEDVGIKGTRDIAEALQSQQLASLGQAYDAANAQYNSDQTRYGDLAKTAGGLEQATGQLGVAGALAGFQGADQLTRMGDEQSKLGYTDAAALEAIGKEQQGLGQRSLDTAYQDFLDQRNLPMDRVKFMSDIIRGIPSSAVGSTRTTEENGPASVYQPSGLSQIVGAYGAYRGLTQPGNARGGYINAAAGGYVDEITGQYITDHTAPRVDHKGHYAVGGLARYANGGKFMRPRMRMVMR